MYQLQKEDLPNMAHLFKDWEETMIYSCLQGKMGTAWANSKDNPISAKILIADFCFYAGVADAQLARHIPEHFPSAALIAVPQTEEWAQMIEAEHQGICERSTRYATKKETAFDRNKLCDFIAALPSEYSILPIDKDLYHSTKQKNWSRDFCSQFPSYEDYQSSGLGFVILHEGEVVCGASSYTIYEGGIEIEIDTKETYRRKGLAKVCASVLILECLRQGLYPSWDAANRESLSLAVQLGYMFDKEYPVYEIYHRLRRH